MTKGIMEHVSTKEMVEILTGREGVERLIVNPHERFKVNIGDKEKADTGPVKIIIVYD